jgi:hypothetical protein
VVIVITGVMAAGFAAIVQDVILGADLPAYAEMVHTRPCHLIVLCPRPEAGSGERRMVAGVTVAYAMTGPMVDPKIP